MKQVKKGPPNGAIYMEDIDYDDEEYVNELIADKVLPAPSNEENLDDEIMLDPGTNPHLLTHSPTHSLTYSLTQTTLRSTNQNFH